MNIEKTMCDRLGYKYKDLFNHLEFNLNKMNSLLNNYGCGLSDNELNKFNELVLKLENGECEIIEFKEQLCKFNVEEKIKEEVSKKEEEKDKEIERLNNIINKAIEYIEKELKDMPENGCSIRLNKILDILKGSDSNE